MVSKNFPDNQLVPEKDRTSQLKLLQFASQQFQDAHWCQPISKG
jgi:hypothetical protein